MIKIQRLNKKFGSNLILNSVNLNIAPGQCYSLLGRNGVGKSTLLNCILNLVKPDSGDIQIKGMCYTDDNIRIKKIIGVVSEENPIITELSGLQYLKFVGLLHEIREKELNKNIESVTTFFFGSTDVLKKNTGNYSTGMKKLLSICAAVLHRPSILILDEPFSGLDIIVALQVIDFLKFYLTPERAILLSSHDMTYVQKVSTHIAVLDSGNIVYDDLTTNFTDNSKLFVEDALLELLMSKKESLTHLAWLK